MKRLLLVLALTGCATDRIDVTVAPPKVWGDDQVLRTLSARARAVHALGSRSWGGDVQELLDVHQSSASRMALTLDVARDATQSTTPAHGAGCGCSLCLAALVALNRPVPGPSSAEAIRRRVEDLGQLDGYELLFLGDTTFQGRRMRALLLRFDLTFRGYVDLGDARRFVVVAFTVESATGGAASPRVYMLSPSWQGQGSIETWGERESDELVASLMGTWDGVGLGGSYSSSEASDYRLQSHVETPLQFALEPGREDPFTFAFAFGPRRRVRERSVLSPARWFGGKYEIRYELDPGPRTCQALLLFDESTQAAPERLKVRAFCDGELVAEDQVDVARALHREVATFDVACGPSIALAPTTTVELNPFASADLLLVSGVEGPSFSPTSTVMLGPIALDGANVELLGRGRLLVHLFNAPALFQLSRQGVREVAGRVITPDQPDFAFGVTLLPERRP